MEGAGRAWERVPIRRRCCTRLGASGITVRGSGNAPDHQRHCPLTAVGLQFCRKKDVWKRKKIKELMVPAEGISFSILILTIFSYELLQWIILTLVLRQELSSGTAHTPTSCWSRQTVACDLHLSWAGNSAGEGKQMLLTRTHTTPLPHLILCSIILFTTNVLFKNTLSLKE